MPLVSILIPSYNHARFLPACLNSVRSQTFQDWEVVLVDDGSKDESVEIARRYALEDPRISVQVNEVNLGTYGTEQRALELCSGQLIAILNSDDFWHEEKLKVQVELLRKHDEAAFAYTLGWLADEHGDAKTDWGIHEDWPTDELQELLPFLLYENRILASGVIFRRNRLRFDPSCRYSGDWVALLRQSLLGPAACSVERLTFWRQHGKNMSLRSKGQVLEEIRVRKAILREPDRWFLPRMDPQQIRRGLAMNALNLQALAALCGHRPLAAYAARLAWRYSERGRRSWKRMLAVFLPMSVVRRRLWKDEFLAVSAKEVDQQAPLAI